MISRAEFNSPLFAAFLCLGVFVGAVTPSVAQEIGQGYTCSGKTILNKKSKTVKLSVAKSAIQKKIDALGSSNKQKAKKTALKAVKAALTACSKGKLSGGGTIPADVAGTYSGTLTRQGAESNDRGCALPATIATSYLVKMAGTTVQVEPASNQFHSDLIGELQAGGFKASRTSAGALGATVRVEMTVTNLTDTSATLNVVKTSERRRVSSCSVTLTGTFTRVKP